MSFLISSLSTTTSIIQSTFAILAISSVKLPVLILDANFCKYKGEGFDLMAACNEPSTNLFLSLVFLLSSVPGFKISNNNTSTPTPAKWQAIRDPITPLPKTATFLIERCINKAFL